MTHRDKRTSDLLTHLIECMKEKDSLTLRDLVDLLEERVFGLSVLLCCIPNCLPVPNVPGLSALTGIPIIAVGLAMAAGRRRLWLPKTLAAKRIPCKKFARVINKSLPYIRKIEVLLHPRLPIPFLHRVLGVAFIVLAVLMSLPIPFGNFLPGMSMALMAIGLIERDGLLIMIGLTMGAATTFALIALADQLTAVLENLFG